jgi:hypothetical protein
MRRLALLTVGMMLVALEVTAQGHSTSQFAASGRSGSSHSLRIVITKDVYEELELLADTLRLETVRCLIGAAQGDSILVDLAWQPPIQRSTTTSVSYRSCPVATIALWHNHPWTREAAPEYSCYLSQTDIREALQPHAPPVQMVHVNASVACWWDRAQVAEHAHEAVVLPLPHQGSGRVDLWSGFACSAQPDRVVCARSAGLGMTIR